MRLSEASGIYASDIYEWISFRSTPYTRFYRFGTKYGMKGQIWKKRVTQLAKFLGCLEEDMFPARYLSGQIRRTSASYEFSEPQLESANIGLRKMINEDNAMIVEKAIGTLDEKERNIVKWSFGMGDDSAKTLGWIGKRVHKSQERVRQIKDGALRKLQFRLKTAYKEGDLVLP